MLSISHGVAGAFIATKVANPYLAIPLIITSHYLLDAIPHWDVGTGLGKGTKSVRSALIQEIPDLLITGLLVFAFFPTSIPIIHDSKFIIQNYSPIWGAFMGLLPDFLEAPRNFLKYEPALLRPINRFHGSFHHSIPHMAAGLAPQLLLLASLWLMR